MCVLLYIAHMLRIFLHSYMWTCIHAYTYVSAVERSGVQCSAVECRAPQGAQGRAVKRRAGQGRAVRSGMQGIWPECPKPGKFMANLAFVLVFSGIFLALQESSVTCDPLEVRAETEMIANGGSHGSQKRLRMWHWVDGICSQPTAD